MSTKGKKTSASLPRAPHDRAAAWWRSLRSGQRWFLSVALVLILFGAAATIYAFTYSTRFLPNTRLAGIPIGGLTRQEAVAKVQERSDAFTGTAVILTYQDRQWDIVPADYGARTSIVASLDEIWLHQKGGRWQEQLKELAVAPFIATRAELGFEAFSPEGEQALTENVLHELETPYREVGLSLVPGNVTVAAGEAGQAVDREALADALYEAFQSNRSTIALSVKPFEPELTMEQAETARAQAEALLAADWSIDLNGRRHAVPAGTVAGWLDTAVSRDADGTAARLILAVKDESVTATLDELAAHTNRPATNARLDEVDGRVVVVQEGRNGVAVDIAATLTAIRTTLLDYQNGERLFAGVVAAAVPEVRSDTLTELGLTQRIGSATTNFSGSPANRRFNIVLGQQKLDGKLIKPSEVYSTINNLGPIEEANGWLSELVIKDNRTIPEAGGGLCQVSTTLFRAVLDAGMPIVERRNHSYRVSYYEREVGPGLDATIYDPKPDFRWRNDLKSHIFVQSSVRGDTVTFELFGTNDGRVATIGKPVILEQTPPGNPIYIQTDTLFEGEQRQLEKPVGGAKTAVSYKVTRNGEEIISQTFQSTYRSWPAQYLVGTKPRPTE